jgi:very-short-patch-repair endonuclease
MRLISKDILEGRIRGKRLGCKHSPEARKMMSEKKRALYASGAAPWNKGLTKDIHPSVGLHNKGQYQTAEDNYARSFPTTSTTIEAAVQIGLYERSIPFLFNVPIRAICRPDFIFPNVRMVLQVDAAYWHRNRKDKDASQDAALTAEGWLVFRWEEKQIKKNLPALLQSLQDAYTSRLNSQNE